MKHQVACRIVWQPAGRWQNCKRRAPPPPSNMPGRERKSARPCTIELQYGLTAAATAHAITVMHKQRPHVSEQPQVFLPSQAKPDEFMYRQAFLRPPHGELHARRSMQMASHRHKTVQCREPAVLRPGRHGVVSAIKLSNVGECSPGKYQANAERVKTAWNNTEVAECPLLSCWRDCRWYFRGGMPNSAASLNWHCPCSLPRRGSTLLAHTHSSWSCMTDPCQNVSRQLQLTNKGGCRHTAYLHTGEAGKAAHTHIQIQAQGAYSPPRNTCWRVPA